MTIPISTVRLSVTLTGPRAYGVCQSCGAPTKDPPWQEHDHQDQPEGIYVFLCAPCSKKLIEPHPRLYGQIMPHGPAPGAMATCQDCKHRDGVVCLSTKLMRNGGPGLLITWTKPPAVAFCRPGGRRYIFFDPPQCKEKVV